MQRRNSEPAISLLVKEEIDKKYAKTDYEIKYIYIDQITDTPTSPRGNFFASNLIKSIK